MASLETNRSERHEIPQMITTTINFEHSNDPNPISIFIRALQPLAICHLNAYITLYDVA